MKPWFLGLLTLPFIAAGLTLGWSGTPDRPADQQIEERKQHGTLIKFGSWR